MLRAGIFYLKINGRMVATTEGEFTCNLGLPKWTAEKTGAGAVAGFSAEAQVPYCEGEIYVTPDIDVKQMLTTKDATVVIEFTDGRTFILSESCYTGEGEFTTKGRLKVRFEGLKGDFT